ncbi:hypothetical protein UPYG_G00333300 [Umbra pygmaea]|uniref:Fork-head domain-containing protein n=1 Tax=Umbra pygmaea TaxID=75934 RepID=A0ABD0VVQ0_UMBPY
MENITENMMGTFPCFQAPTKAVERRKNQRYGKQRNITYLGLIAYVLQNSPDKMLTFSRLMDELVVFVSGDRKGIENNIRVCLSSNDCFVKVPCPDLTYSKGNFWKVDVSRITAKMARRNFKGILDQFPDLSTKVKMEANELSVASEHTTRTKSPTTTMCPNIQTRTVGMFTSSFSIESLLNRDSPRVCPQIPSLPVVSSLPTNQGIFHGETRFGTKRRMSRDSAPIEMHGVPCPDRHMIWSRTDYGVIGHDAGRTFKKMRMCTEHSYPIYFRHSTPCFAEPILYPEYEMGYPVHM